MAANDRVNSTLSLASQVFLLLLIQGHLQAERCADRSIQGERGGKVTGDNGFSLSLTGDPQTFIPGATYILRLKGDKDQFTKKQFQQFVLTVQNDDQDRETESGSAGTFQLFGDIHSRFSDHCTNTIMQTSDVEKEEIQVLWDAPPSGRGCVQFKASVLEAGGAFAMDDDRLTLNLCEEKVDEEEANIIHEECCACEEAKYEVMFQGLWSKETHPRDFPSSEWLLHFSDVIGASHDINYRVWEAGGYASKGLTQVAKWGSPRMLESELKAESKHIRTIIKARGLWHPNVNGKTFAIFRTDSKNHLMSLVSMLGPSPDWIVGVSALEMCQANCTWLDKKEIFLYPWDAGVDSGISYESQDSPTTPNEPIKRITTQDPADDNSPFFKSGGGKFKPLAKISIQKLREYKKSCGDDSQHFGDQTFGKDFSSAVPAGCEMTGWTEWSGCSVSCGKGISMRERKYLDPFTSDNVGCDAQLVQKEMCASDVPVCEGETSFYSSAPTDWVPDDTCATTEWTDWSKCSTPCGEGFRARTRRFFNRMGRKKCPHVDTVMKQTCQGERQLCALEEMEVVPPECAVTDWSNWSPCSQSCGSGLKVRTRLYRVSKEEQLEASCSVQLMQKGACIGDDKMCEADGGTVCSQKKEIGPCRGTFKRWYFDSNTGTCQEFFFGGCRGNSNNFIKFEDCEKRCRKEAVRIGGIENMYLNDGFRDALDVLVKKRREDLSEGMNEGFIEIEEQKQVLQRLENEQKTSEAEGKDFLRIGELMAAQKKLMMMEKRMMMDKQMQMFKQKQMMMAKQRQMQEQKQKQMMTGSIHTGNDMIRNTTHDNVDRDCEVTAWSPWSVQCSSSCGRGYRHRFRTVSQDASGDGRQCPRKLERQKKCRLPPCPDDCQVTAWEEWGPCSQTCGGDGTQTRQRYSLGTEECGHMVEERVCLLPCCRGERGGCV